jgi:methylglyoxal/glyoxal reductase
MHITDIKGTVKLHNGVGMPYFGLGVFEAPDTVETIQAIHWALEAGYRHIDTAALYRNEKSVGEAVKTSGIPRDDIFITTKVWNSDHGFQKTLDAFRRSLELLQLDYADLYLIHWPVRNKFIETWEALEELYDQKLTRAIGVSNFNRHHLEELVTRHGMVPMVNQAEFHPFLVQSDLQRYCQEQLIQFEAWSPILRGGVNDIPELVQIAEKYQKTAVQVTLRWDLQKEVVTIPKSVRKERIVSNAEIFDFELTPEEIAVIDSLNRDNRTGADPDNFNF